MAAGRSGTARDRGSRAGVSLPAPLQLGKCFSSSATVHNIEPQRGLGQKRSSQSSRTNPSVGSYISHQAGLPVRPGPQGPRRPVPEPPRSPSRTASRVPALCPVTATALQQPPGRLSLPAKGHAAVPTSGGHQSDSSRVTAPQPMAAQVGPGEKAPGEGEQTGSPRQAAPGANRRSGWADS